MRAAGMSPCEIFGASFKFVRGRMQQTVAIELHGPPLCLRWTVSWPEVKLDAFTMMLQKSCGSDSKTIGIKCRVRDSIACYGPTFDPCSCGRCRPRVSFHGEIIMTMTSYFMAMFRIRNTPLNAIECLPSVWGVLLVEHRIVIRTR